MTPVRACGALGAILVLGLAAFQAAVAQAPSTTPSVAGAGGAATSVAGSLTTGPLYPLALHAEPEVRLISILETVRRGDVAAALGEAEALVAAQPNFRLAQLVYGDLLASRAGAPLSLESGSLIERRALDPLLAEARQRWRHFRRAEEFDRLPEPIVQLDDRQYHALLVDVASSRLYVFENREGRPELIADHYVSIGKNGARKERRGDRRTPVGVYFITDRLPGEGLPDKYGPVAFPVDYPNTWDRRKGRTGSGIWLHGIPSNTYSRPPQDSDGCVALSNEELVEIAPLLEAGVTPVVITETPRWIDADAWLRRREDLTAALERWRRDWSSRDTRAYLSHYDRGFRGRGMDLRSWSAYKRRVNGNKRYIRVELHDVSMFDYPGERDMVVVSFRQQYDSDTYRSDSRKRQYWRRGDDGRWRIVSEETV